MSAASQNGSGAGRSDHKELRLGFSTGTAAAAAAKAALRLLLEGQAPHTVPVDLPDGGSLSIAVEEVRHLSGQAAGAAVAFGFGGACAAAACPAPIIGSSSI